MSLLAGARCAVHAELAAVDVCTRCGSFLCGECVELVRDVAYCERCAQLLLADRPTARARSAVLMTAVGLLAMVSGFRIGPPGALIVWVVGALVGLAGLATALVERRAIPGDLPMVRRRRLVWVAVVLGIGHVVCVALVAGLFITFAALHLARGG